MGVSRKKTAGNMESDFSQGGYVLSLYIYVKGVIYVENVRDVKDVERQRAMKS